MNTTMSGHTETNMPDRHDLITPAGSLRKGIARRPAQRPNGRFFNVGAAVALIGLMIWGFQLFYFRGQAYPGRELTPPIRTLLILHGIGMTGWMVLFLVQPLLIVGGYWRVHMMLGRAGAALALVIVVLGLRLGIESTRVSPPGLRIWGLPPRQFMAVPVISIVMFGGLVAAGILNRRRPEVHRSLMLLATLAAMPAAVSRINALNALYHETIWERVFGPFFGTLVIALIFLLVKWTLTRSLDRLYAIGCAGLIVSSALIMVVAPTSTWELFASFLLR